MLLCRNLQANEGLKSIHPKGGKVFGWAGLHLMHLVKAEPFLWLVAEVRGNRRIRGIRCEGNPLLLALKMERLSGEGTE